MFIYAVFATDRELRAMEECSTLYFDGTFRTTPRPNTQIVTIHGLFRYTQWIIPLGMALLGGKTLAHYQCMLLSLKAGVLKASGRPLTPTKTLLTHAGALRQTRGTRKVNKNDKERQLSIAKDR